MVLFTVNKPAGSDEDSPPFNDSNMLIICDGLGGTGQNPHEIDGKVYTSAYLGSRYISKAAADFFASKKDHVWEEDLDALIHEFKNKINGELQRQIQKNGLKKKIKGRSAQFLPSTLAMAIYKEQEEELEILVIWAGDSRVYLLSSTNGLQQISEDDVEQEFDAMDSLGTSNMNNCINGEGEEAFHVNYARYRVNKQENQILFACSDGCFDYFETPMDFEYLLERAMFDMQDSDSMELYGNSLSKYYSGSNLKDDTTMAGVIFNETSPAKLKQQYSGRLNYVEKNFREPTQKYAEDIAQAEFVVGKYLPRTGRLLKNLVTDLGLYFEDLVSRTEKLSIPDQKLKDEIFRLSCIADLQERIQKNAEETEMAEQELQCKKSNREAACADLRTCFEQEYTKYYIHEKNEEGKFSLRGFFNELAYFLDRRPLQNDWEDQVKRLETAMNSMRRELLPAEWSSMRQRLHSVVDKVFYDESLNETMYMKEEHYFSHLCTEPLPDGEIPIWDKSSSEERNVSEEGMDEVQRNLINRGIIERAWQEAVEDNFSRLGRTGFFKNSKCRYAEIKKTEAEIKELEEKRNELKWEIDASEYVSKRREGVVREFLETEMGREYLPTELRQKVEEYSRLKKEQDSAKKAVAKGRQEIKDLWRKQYKISYELYKNKAAGGMI